MPHKLRFVRYLVTWLLPATVLVVLMRLVRPLVSVRIGRLTSERIGHYAFDPELYLCKRDAEPARGRTLDIFYNWHPISNEQLKKMWGRTLRVWQFSGAVDRVNRRIPGSAAHVLPIDPWTVGSQDMRALVGLTKPHLTFTAEEERLGRQALAEMGIGESSQFICFHARDSSYLQTALNMASESYNYRDANINNYVPAMEELAKRKHFAVRMGAVVEKKIGTHNELIIDYASGYRTAFLDMFLCSNCRFFLGSHTGLFETAAMFRRPAALVNVIPFGEANTWNSNDMFIPKKLWLTEEQRYMTFREIFEQGVSNFNSTGQYRQAGIQPVENTPEEITAFVLEMDDRLNGTWETTKEDEEMQARFWSAFKPLYYHGPTVSRIGSDFLRQNQELLA